MGAQSTTITSHLPDVTCSWRSRARTPRRGREAPRAPRPRWPRCRPSGQRPRGRHCIVDHEVLEPLLRVELLAEQWTRDLGRLGAERRVERIGERVGRIGGEHERAMTAVSCEQRGRRRRRCLAHSPFAGEAAGSAVTTARLEPSAPRGCAGCAPRLAASRSRAGNDDFDHEVVRDIGGAGAHDRGCELVLALERLHDVALIERPGEALGGTAVVVPQRVVRAPAHRRCPELDLARPVVVVAGRAPRPASRPSPTPDSARTSRATSQHSCGGASIVMRSVA